MSEQDRPGTGARIPVGSSALFRRLCDELDAAARHEAQHGRDPGPLDRRAMWAHGAGRILAAAEACSTTRELERRLAETRELWSRPLTELSRFQREGDQAELGDDEGPPT